VVEHSLGKGEVTSSILVMGSKIQRLLQSYRSEYRYRGKQDGKGKV
jgi:hypothetical protein